MKKQLLLLTSKSELTVSWTERERYIKEFCEAAQLQLEDFEIAFTTYQDLQFIVRDSVVTVFDTRNEVDLSVLDLVHFKNWMYELEEASTLAGYFEKRGVTFLNSEVNIGVATGKIAQMVRLAEHGLPVPDTFYARKSLLKKLFLSQNLPQGFTYPLIMKANDGSKGDDNYLVKDAERALRILEDPKNFDKEFVLQNFIPNDGDLRLLFIGLDETPLIFRRVAQSGSHLNNTSKGGTGEFIAAQNLPKQYIDDAKKAAEILKREICGVDIIVNKKTGRHYILEVNATPALATGYGLEAKLDMFVAFVKRSVDAFEEE